MTPGAKNAEEVIWSSLSEEAQTILEALASRQRGDAGGEALYFEVATESAPMRAGLAVLLSMELVESREVPHGPLVYRASPTGAAVELFGRPEDEPEARETKRVSDFLNRRRKR